MGRPVESELMTWFLHITKCDSFSCPFLFLFCSVFFFSFLTLTSLFILWTPVAQRATATELFCYCLLSLLFVLNFSWILGAVGNSQIWHSKGCRRKSGHGTDARKTVKNDLWFCRATKRGPPVLHPGIFHCQSTLLSYCLVPWKLWRKTK